MFKIYQSKPIERHAHKITEQDEIHKHTTKEATYELVPYGSPVSFEFKAYEEVKVGDYIVRLTVEATYHCSAKVFEERNIV